MYTVLVGVCADAGSGASTLLVVHAGCLNRVVHGGRCSMLWHVCCCWRAWCVLKVCMLGGRSLCSCELH